MASFRKPTLDETKLANVVNDLSIIIHAPPDFPQGSEILGVCGVSEENSGSEAFGWMVKDFLAWKSLHYQVGHRQSQVTQAPCYLVPPSDVFFICFLLD
jgi:hypothetical protein